MKEQELREKIAELLYHYDGGENWELEPETSPHYLVVGRASYYRNADRILALVKEALPELAKEAGYMKLAEDKSLLEIPAEEFCYYCGFPASDPVHNTVIKKYYHLFLSDRCATLYRMATGGF